MRRYNPEQYIEHYDYGDSYSGVRMVECEGGNWVPYENAYNETQRLRKRIIKLELKIVQKGADK